MSSSVSESLNIEHYLPILDKIKSDLNIIYERDYLSNTKLPQLSFDSVASSIGTVPETESEINSRQSPKTAWPATDLAIIENLVPKEYITPDSTILGSLQSYVISLQDSRHHAVEECEEVSMLKKDLVAKNKLIEERNVCIDDLQSELDSAQDAINKYKEDQKQLSLKNEKCIEEMQQIIDDKEKEIKEMKRVLTDNDKEMTELKQLIADKDNTIKEKDDVIGRQLKNNDKGQLNDEYEMKIKEQNEKIQRLKNETSELNANIKSNEQEHNKMIKSKDDQIALLIKDIENDTNETAKLQNTLDSKIKLVHTLQSQIETMDALKDDLESKQQVILVLESQVKELNNLKDDQSRKEELISDLTKKLRQNESNLSDVDYSTMTATLKAKRTEIKNRDNELKKLQTKLEDMENNVDKAERETRRAKTQLDNKTKEVQELENTVAEYEVQIKELKKKAREAERRAANNDDDETYRKEIQALKVNISNNKKEIERIKTECTNINNLKNTLENKLKDRESEISIKIKENVGLSKQLDDANKKIKEKDISIKDKQTALDVMKGKIKDKKDNPVENTDVRFLQREIEAKDAEMGQMEQKIENYKNNLEEKYSECDKLTKDNEKLKAEIENIKIINFNSRDAPDRRLPSTRLIPEEPRFRPAPSPNPGNWPDMPNVPEWWKKHMHR